MSARVISVAAAALVACHPAAPPARIAPGGPTPCARAADSMVRTMLVAFEAQAMPPVETSDALRNLIREHCEHDRWSAEATRCLIATKTMQDTAGCAPLLSDEQQTALAQDEAARLDAPDRKPKQNGAPGHPEGAP